MIVQMPDGTQVSFPDTMSETSIRGLIAQKYPREVGEAGAAKPLSERDTSGHSTYAPDSAPRHTAAIMGAINGLPIVGPYAQAGVEKAAAGIGSALTGVPYDQARSEISTMVDQSTEQHPNITTAGNIGGGILGLIPAIMAAPEVFGAGGGASLLQNMLMGGLSGGTVAGVDAGVRSDWDPAAMLSAAKWGLGLGTAGPLAGKAVGAGVRAVSDWAGSGGTAAERAFGRAATADSALEMAPRLQALGDQAMPMDLGPNLQRQAGALAATPGRGQAIVRDAVAARDASANARITGGLNAEIGRAPIPSQITEGIRANQQALGPAYEEALQGARAVNTEPIANNLDAMATRLRGPAQRAVQQVRRMLDVTGTDVLDPNPQTLLQTRHAIDGLLAGETDTNAIRALTATRQQINRELERAVPGIRQVDARFEELGRQNDALGRGQQALDSGRTAPRPIELQADITDGAVPVGDTMGPSAVPLRLRQGARAEIDRIVGTNANDRVALQRLVKGEGDWNRERLASLFGQDRANRIIGILDRERQFADTSSTVTRNSETAARVAAQNDTTLPAGRPGFLRSVMNLRFGDATADVAGKAIGGAKTAAQNRMNEELAGLLTSRDPAAVSRAVRIVQAAQRRGDITMQRSREIIQSLAQSPPDRQPLEFTTRVLGAR